MLYRPRPIMAITLLATFFACGGGGGAGTTAPAPAAPSFSLAVSPTSLQVAAGGSATVAVTVSRLNGFKGDITLTGIGLPTGITATGLVPDGTSSYPLNIQVGASAAQITFTDLHIEGRGGGLVQVASFSLSVRAPLSRAQGSVSALQAAGGLQRVGAIENVVVAQEPIRAQSAAGPSGTVQVRHGYLPTASPQQP